MKRFLPLVPMALLLVGLIAYAAGPAGVRVTDRIVPTSTNDTYPTHEAKWGKGGWRSVVTDAELLTIPQARRESGMAVWSDQSKETYILLADMTNWVRAGGGTINARRYGAKGNGIADDSDALQAAIDAAGSSYSLYIPYGTYRLGKMLVLRDGLNMYGDGFNTVLQVAHAGNGLGNPGVLEGGTRLYYLRLAKFRITTAAGIAASNALSLTDVSASTFSQVDFTEGAGHGFKRCVDTFGNYSIPDQIWGGNWHLTFFDCDFYVSPGPNTYSFYGSGGPGATGGPNNLQFIACYFHGLPAEEGDTPGSTAGAFIENCNQVAFIGGGFEGFHTNGIIVGTNVQSLMISDSVRFEIQGGTTAERRCIKFREYTTQGHVIIGNHLLLQGGGGSLTRIAGPDANPTRIPATIIDPSYEGANQILADTLLVGTYLDTAARTYTPSGNRIWVMDTRPGATNSIGAAIIDGTINPRLLLVMKGTNRNELVSASSVESIPLYVMGADTYAAFGVNGSGILGEPVPGVALSVHGALAVGPDPKSAWIEGLTPMSHGLFLRSSNAADRIGFWAGTVEGVTNRRVELYVDSPNERALLRTTYGLGQSRIDVEVGNDRIAEFSTAGLKANRGIRIGDGTNWVELLLMAPGGSNQLVARWPNGATNILSAQP